MSEDMITGLLAMRAELASQVQALQVTIYHIDGTLNALGHSNGPRRTARLFRNGELISLVGEAERAGAKTVGAIVAHITKARGFDAEDEALHKKLMMSVKECRKRTSPRDV